MLVKIVLFLFTLVFFFLIFNVLVTMISMDFWTTFFNFLVLFDVWCSCYEILLIFFVFVCFRWINYLTNCSSIFRLMIWSVYEITGLGSIPASSLGLTSATWLVSGRWRWACSSSTLFLPHRITSMIKSWSFLKRWHQSCRVNLSFENGLVSWI